MVKESMLAILLFLLALPVFGQGDEPIQHPVVPEQGFVPNPATATAIAEAVLVPIYGADSIQRQEPFKVELHNDVWVVEGTLPRRFVGGVFTMEISKATAAVLRVTHSK